MIISVSIVQSRKLSKTRNIFLMWNAALNLKPSRRRHRMNFIETIFFIYLFISLYMTSLLIFIWYPNRNKLFFYPRGSPAPVSIVIPCYNEAETIGEAIESLLRLNYPSEMIEGIVVDDKSKDNS